MTKVSPVSPDAKPERNTSDESAATVEAVDVQPASGKVSQSQAPDRKSSLRPAPPDYRPSERDLSKLRPMAVVRAGDAEPDQLPLENPGVRADSVDSGRETLPPEVPEVTTDSSRDLIPDHAPTSKRPKYSFVSVVLVSVVLVGAGVAVLRGTSHHATNPNPQLRAHVEPVPQQPTAFKPSEALPVAHESGPNAPATQPAATAESAATSPIDTALPDTTRVTLDLAPMDAKVHLRGREIPGPPFVFDIAKGQRVELEVIRFGFATARVVLDDRKPLVHFGMLREHKAKAR